VGGPRPTGTASTVTAAATSNAGDAVRVPANLKCQCPVVKNNYPSRPQAAAEWAGCRWQCWDVPFFLERESFSIKTCPVKATLGPVPSVSPLCGHLRRPWGHRPGDLPQGPLRAPA
jgi:hypothetical protein